MALSRIMRNFVVFVDGFGKVGNGSECMLPKITEKVEDYRGGGMDRPIEVPLGGEKLEASFKLTSFDEQVIGKCGLLSGREVSIVFRGSLGSTDGTSIATIARMLAGIKEWDPSNWKPGEKVENEFKLRVNRYTLHVGETRLIHIDPLNLIEERLGVNQLEQDRVNLGL